MARLRVVKGNDEGKVYELPAFEWVIGRGTKCDVVIDDPRASRQHACVRLHRGEWMVRDLGSAGGTFVNKEKHEGWTAIRDGDRVRIGHTLLQFEDHPAAAPSGDVAGKRAGRPAEASPVRAAAAEPAPSVKPLPDQVEVPGHHVYDRIGDGATGTVYRGRQLDRDRPVAIKVLAPALAKQPEYVARFEREARAAAELSHPHVVGVYLVGHHRGLHYFTMELMEQGTVEDRLTAAPGGRLPWPEAVKLVSDAAAGLAHVHQHGLVHRDIKPANLLLGADGTVKLGDLGTLVREADAQGVRIGTPYFMAPEQARRERVTRASDVYSLGATLYCMLTGETPHTGATLRELVRAVAHDVPLPIESKREGLPQVVADEINAMMARDPAHRPVDAAEVGQRLAAALEDVHEDRRSRRQQRRRTATSRDVLIRVVPLVLVVGAIFAFRSQIGRGVADLTGSGEQVPTGAPPVKVEPDPVVVEPEPEPAGPTAEETTRRFATIRDLEKTRPPVQIGGEAVLSGWAAIAQEYEDFVDTHPLEAPEVLEAHRRARQIRYALIDSSPVSSDLARRVDETFSWTGLTLEGDPNPPELRLVKGGKRNPLRDERFDRLTAVERAIETGDMDEIRRAFGAATKWAIDAKEREGKGATSAEKDAATVRGAIEWLRFTGRIVAARLDYDLARDARVLSRHMRRTGFFSGLDGLADASVATERLLRVREFMATRFGRQKCEKRRQILAMERATWASALSSGATPESVADAISEGWGTIAREHVDGAIWLLLETGRRYRAEEVLDGRRLNDPKSAELLREQVDALRELATLGDAPDPEKVVRWSLTHPSVELVLVGKAAEASGYHVFPPAMVREVVTYWAY